MQRKKGDASKSNDFHSRKVRTYNEKNKYGIVKITFIRIMAIRTKISLCLRND